MRCARDGCREAAEPNGYCSDHRSVGYGPKREEARYPSVICPACAAFDMLRHEEEMTARQMAETREVFREHRRSMIRLGVVTLLHAMVLACWVWVAT